MKSISTFSTNHPVTVLMIILAVLLLGYVSFQRLGIDLFPDLESPRLYVELTADEAPPDEIERQYVESIEGRVIGQKGVTRVSSIIRVGAAQVTVEYKWNMDMEEAYLNLQKAVTDLSQVFDDIEEISVSQYDPNADPIMLLAFSHPDIDNMDELRLVARNYIRNELIRLDGVAEVEIAGDEEKEIVIETDSYLLEAFGLTPESVTTAVISLNQNISGGSIVEMGRRYLIKGEAAFSSLSDIENLVVAFKEADGAAAAGTAAAAASASGTSEERVPVYLKDLATVSFVNREPKSIVRLNGSRCLGLSVYREMKYNTVKATEGLLEGLKTVRRALPGYDITVVKNQGEFIVTAINEVKQTALIGILLAVIILYVFLRRLGTTAIISIAIPISIVATFNLMYFNGLTLNIMTLGGLALGAGMLVDNAIVVMESIIRNIEAGHGVREASITGTAQVGGAIVASTVTTIVVFLPIVYLHGASGELFKDQAWTVAFSLLSSLVVAVLVIPMLSTRFLGGSEHSSGTNGGARSDGTGEPEGAGGGTGRSARAEKKSITFGWYPGLLSRILDRRWTVIAFAAGLVALTALILPRVGSEFIPKTDPGEFSLEITLPQGTELHRTESTVQGIEEIVGQLFGDHIEMIFSRVGPVTGMGGDESAIFQDENTASIKIILRDGHGIKSDRIVGGLSAALSDMQGLEIQFVQDQTALQTTLGTESAPIAVEIRGDDLDVLEDLTAQVALRLTGIEGLYNIETTLEQGRPEINIVLDRLRAGMYGIGVEDVSGQLKDKLMGRDAGAWDEEGEQRDIVVRMPEIGVSDLDDFKLIKGNMEVRLSEVADIRSGSAPKEIQRRNQVRIGRVTAHHRKGRSFDRLVGDIEREITRINLPSEYRIDITGEEEKRREAFGDLRFALILSVILVYMVLASQFESIVHPFTILLTIPLAGVGAVLIFFFLGRSLNIMAYIGFIMLAGIAVNDSIILVDAINQLVREGFGRRAAIIEAGRRRIRPIVMTSATTILALLPLTFGFGEGAALRSPMALAVIGGLVTSTLLTLAVIPCVYDVLDRAREYARS